MRAGASAQSSPPGHAGVDVLRYQPTQPGPLRHQQSCRARPFPWAASCCSRSVFQCIAPIAKHQRGRQSSPNTRPTYQVPSSGGGADPVLTRPGQNKKRSMLIGGQRGVGRRQNGEAEGYGFSNEDVPLHAGRCLRGRFSIRSNTSLDAFSVPPVRPAGPRVTDAFLLVDEASWCASLQDTGSPEETACNSAAIPSNRALRVEAASAGASMTTLPLASRRTSSWEKRWRRSPAEVPRLVPG